ncbi:hypothetical protein SeMB42_g02157 [Synchytrium endobioticum]|uniref:Phytoene desaturase n=1 Tax=Synchytrium endobioticum TaxID=286115 RepID=A0A507CVN0_9FUNG|nr:hypothetical protein SeLEV6574_g05152 [Synchytrium endobioticum]TPX50738.1 hypothetical protein SeMB42_g02157 [Synchytrium endobioticum]
MSSTSAKHHDSHANEPRKRIVIIGAGVGGVAVAARLSKAGHQVDVVEKNASCGGRCSLITTNGFRFDVGPSLYLMPEIFKETFADLDADVNAEVDLIKCEPNYRIYFLDEDDDSCSSSMTISTNLTQLKSEIERLEPRTGWPGFLAFIKEGQTHYQLSEEMVLRKNFENWYDFFTGANLIYALRIHVFFTMWSRVCKYFRSDELKRAFTFQAMYMGQSPFEAPATYNLLQYTELAEGVWYPKGGFNTVIERMEGIAKKNGATFHYNAPAKRIIIDEQGRLATGIELEDGRTIKGDIVICNADLVWAYNNLLLPSDKSYGQQLARKEFTSSTFSFYWGMKTVVEGLESHNIFLAKDYKASFDKIFKEYDLPTHPSFYIHVPSRHDSTAAPAGKDCITVLVPVGHIKSTKRQDWKALQQKARTAVIEILERKLGISDFASLIEVENVNTPETWRDTYNLYHGSALGLSHNIFQVGWFRPSTRHAEYGNIFFVGASTHPGTGVPVVLYSARLVARQVAVCIKYGLKQSQGVKLTELISAIFIIGLVVLAAMYLPKSWILMEEVESVL